MKRSEMVEKIYNALYGAQMREDFANQILEVVETCGMLPPLYMKEVPNMVISKVDQETKKVLLMEEGQTFSTVNEWEPEAEVVNEGQ